MRKPLIKSIKQEYDLFYEKILLLEKTEILDHLSKIRFYDNIYEYILYNDNIPKEIEKYLYRTNNVISSLWNYYLKYEYFSIENWNCITEFLLLLADKDDNCNFVS